MTQFKRATPDDAPALSALVVAFRDHLQRSAPSDQDLARNVAHLLESADAEFYLCLRGGRPVGYVLQRFRHSLWANGREATIEDLFVHPEARQGGLGKALIGFALDQAKAKDCRSVCLDTNEHNDASQRIYRAFGFTAFSQRWQGNQVFYRLNLPGA